MKISSRRVAIGATAAIAMMGFGSAAQALCTIDSGAAPDFRNDVKEIHGRFSNADGNTYCRLFFNDDSNRVFAASSVTTSPLHGKLVKTDVRTFRYIPQPGFIGEERFELKLSGSVYGNVGVSTMRYNMQVVNAAILKLNMK